VKFGDEEYTKFRPIGAVVEFLAPNLKFYAISEYKRPARAYRLGGFLRQFQFVGNFVSG